MFAFRLICIGIFCVHVSHSIAVGDGPVLFNRDIRPILSDHCFQCHGPDEARRQGDLRLDSATFAYQANASGEHAILPRNPEGSVLLHRVQSNDAGLKMPPPESGKVLKPHQISLLERWIREGAIYEGHWAFQPPTRPQVPVAQAHLRVTNPIDAFVLANLEARGFTMAPEAEPRHCFDESPSISPACHQHRLSLKYFSRIVLPMPTNMRWIACCNRRGMASIWQCNG